jgi:hypothetical protein
LFLLLLLAHHPFISVITSGLRGYRTYGTDNICIHPTKKKSQKRGNENYPKFGSENFQKLGNEKERSGDTGNISRPTNKKTNKKYNKNSVHDFVSVGKHSRKAKLAMM